MKKHSKTFILFSIIYFIILICVIVFLCLKQYGVSILIGAPSLFLIPIYLSFKKIPERTNKHIFTLIVLIIGRYFLALIAMLLPTLLWYYIPTIKEQTNSLLLLIPFIEVIFVYNIVIVENIFDSKKQIARMNKKE